MVRAARLPSSFVKHRGTGFAKQQVLSPAGGRRLHDVSKPGASTVLGPHDSDDGLWVRALLPGAQAVAVMHSGSGWPLAELDRQGGSDLFAGLVPASEARLGYLFQVDWGTHSSLLDDPYRFSFVLGEADVWLLAEGTHLRPFEQLGAHLREIDGVRGVAFAVWAPNARRVSVVADFNQ